MAFPSPHKESVRPIKIAINIKYRSDLGQAEGDGLNILFCDDEWTKFIPVISLIQIRASKICPEN